MFVLFSFPSLIVFLIAAYKPAFSSIYDIKDIENDINMNELGEQIRAIIEHFKQPEPVGFPGAPIPEPMPIPDLKHTKSFTTLNLKNATVHGLSKFKIEHLQSNLANMQMESIFKYQKLEILGNYTLTAIFSRSHGGFNVTLTEVYFDALANLIIGRDGHLEATDINMDIIFHNIIMDFKNLGFLGSMFQGMINTIGSFIFDSIKPFILSEVNTNIRGDINKMLKQLQKTFPNSIPPLDLAIAEGRNMVREKGFDPYEIPDYKYSSGIFSVSVNTILLSGLATFYRIGNITLTLSNNTLQIDSHMSTQQLEGKCDWEVSVGKMFSRYGSTSFTTEYVQVQTKLNQSLDVRNKPKLEEINIKLGNLQLRMDGIGTLDYALEVLANILPNILRYQIIDAVEGVLKQRIQTVLDSFDVEKYIEQNIQNLDNMMVPNRTRFSESFESTENPFDIDHLYDEIAL